MRGCLTFIGIWLVIGLLAVWFALPPVLDGVATASLSAAGFSGTDTRVGVAASPPLRLATLHADDITIKSTQATLHDLHMESVDLTLHDVGLLDRSFASVEGTLTGVRYEPAGGGTFQATSVIVSGPPGAAKLDIRLSPADVRVVATAAGQASLGLTPSQVVLAAPDRITFTVSGRSISGRLAIDGTGALVLRLGAGPVSAIELLRPSASLPLTLRSFAITSDGLDLIAAIDLAALR